jgi:hypothetical protein
MFRSYQWRRRVTALLVLTMTPVASSLWAMAEPASAAGPGPAVMLDTSKCVCHPGRPCICPFIAPDGKITNFSIQQKQLKNLQNSVQ